ncbi:MAG: response regulator [Bacteroidota bacterium]
MDTDSNNIFYYVLIVDDDKDDHLFLRQAIAEVIPQAIVESLYDGSEALNYLDNCTALPNLIFLDLNMSRISGRSTISVIRKNESLRSVPVVILTTSKSDTERVELMELGANEFYSKPDHPRELVNIVQKVSAKYLD